MNFKLVLLRILGSALHATASEIHSAVDRATTLPASEEKKIDPTGAIQGILSVVGAVADAAIDSEADAADPVSPSAQPAPAAFTSSVNP